VQGVFSFFIPVFCLIAMFAKVGMRPFRIAANFPLMFF
jgi:hypothetical protein